MSLNAPFTPNTVISSSLVSADITGLASGANIANGVITADKLGTGAASATVATSQTTTSTTYADLATVGPSVTVTIGANGLALVIISSLLANSASGVDVLTAVVVSGANTISGTTNESSGTLHLLTAAINQSVEASYARLYTGLTAGSTTFTLQYRVTGNTGTFARRWITVIPF